MEVHVKDQADGLLSGSGGPWEIRFERQPAHPPRRRAAGRGPAVARGPALAPGPPLLRQPVRPGGRHDRSPGRPPGAGHRVLSPGRYDILKAEALPPRASTDPAGKAFDRWT